MIDGLFFMILLLLIFPQVVFEIQKIILNSVGLENYIFTNQVEIGRAHV